MANFIDPSLLTPLFTAQQVTCAYPISDFYADTPRYLYYSLLVGCILIRWHPWLSDVFLGAAATYAGVAALEAFVLLAGYQRPGSQETVSIPFIDPASVPGNSTYAALPNLVTNQATLTIRPAVFEFDIDAILAIVVTGYLFMLPVHCWSTHVRGNRARHLLMGLWNITMLCAGICALILWTRLADYPYQYRFCYPQYPDIDSVSSDGWISSLWAGSWNSTTWNVFSNPALSNGLTENCFYPCFNTSQVLRQSTSIVANIRTNDSPRTDNSAADSYLEHQSNLAFFMYVAIIISAVTAIFVLLVTVTGATRFTVIPLHQPWLLWTDRKQIVHAVTSDFQNLFHRSKKVKKQQLPRSEKEAAQVVTLQRGDRPKRCVSAIRLLAHLIAFLVLLIVVIAIPVTWVVFIIWIEVWISRDIVSKETPRQIGQWAPAVSVGLVLLSALILRLKYKIASEREIEDEITELRQQLTKLEVLKEKKS